jgi:ATP-binding cassette, subfamily B, bacterial
MSFSQDDDAFQGKLDLKLWGRVYRHALPHKRLLRPLFASAVLIAATEATFPLVTKRAIDAAVESCDAFAVWPFAVAFFLLAALLSIGVWLFIDKAGSVSNHVAHDIRRAGFDRLQELELAYYDARPAGWLISRLTSDCDRLARILAWGFTDLVWGLCLVFMLGGILLWLDWRLGLIALAALPPLAVISAVFQKRILRSAREIRRMNSQITASYSESIAGTRTTKTLGRERANLEEFSELSSSMYLASVRNARQAAIYVPLVTAIGSMAVGLSLWRGGVGVMEGAITLGTLVAFLTCAGQFFNPINQIAQILANMQGAQAAAERVLSLLATEPKIRDSASALERLRMHAAANPPSPHLAPDGLPAQIETLEFRDVSFSYASGESVMKRFNLTVRAGETVALVGPSGGGKTTLVSIACRFYEPTEGEVLINGVDYRERSLDWLQSCLGLVLQTPRLFAGSIRENIRYGRLAATDAEVEAAARAVRADHFISQLEGGFDAEVGEGGGRLSTGQRQLISFARAVLANPQIFVMDEATSSIDAETELLIQDALQRVFRGRISFVIAHRLSTIRRADRILFIAGGRIIESGRHEELLRQRGRYFELYTKQFREEQEQRVFAGPAH